MDLEIKTDQVDLDQSMYYMQMSLPTAAPFDMNRYQYQQNYPGAIFAVDLDTTHQYWPLKSNSSLIINVMDTALNLVCSCPNYA